MTLFSEDTYVMAICVILIATFAWQETALGPHPIQLFNFLSKMFEGEDRIPQSDIHCNIHLDGNGFWLSSKVNGSPNQHHHPTITTTQPTLPPSHNHNPTTTTTSTLQ